MSENERNVVPTAGIGSRGPQEEKPYDAPEGIDTGVVGGIAGGAEDVKEGGIEGMAEAAGITTEELKEAIVANDPLGIVNPRPDTTGEAPTE